jgi:hypothetical protein
MDVGISIRNMGTQSTPALMAACAQAVEEMGFESPITLPSRPMTPRAVVAVIWTP